MTFKKKMLTWAGMLATLAILGHYYSKPLIAQVRAALVRDSDNPALQPVMIGLSAGGGFPQSFHVPAGKRFVIEYMSWRASGGVNAGLITSQAVNVTVNGTTATIYVPGSPVTGENIGGQKVFIVADPDTNVIYQSAGSIGTQPIYIIGYYVNIP
jgi:hypothetical protein